MVIKTDSEALAVLTEFSIDQLEERLVGMDQPETKVYEWFVPGMYIREVHIPAGTMGTSMIHRFDHPFVVSKGTVAVTSETEGSVIYEAPHTGITKAGTRRALFAETDVVWTTFHVTEETDVEKIAEQILIPYTNPLLGEGHPSANQWRNFLPTT